MGYPVDKIGKDTLLYSHVGVNAIEEKYSDVFNYYLQEKDFDAKMMPLNIREDDLYFFINGLKNSKIKGTYFSKEYWNKISNLLDHKDDNVSKTEMCDYIEIKDGKNIGRLIYGDAYASLLKENMTIAIYGSTNDAKNFLLSIQKKRPKKIILADLIVENTIDMQKLIVNSDIEIDIQRNTADKLKADAVYNNKNLTLKIEDKTYNYMDNLDIIAKILTREWIDK